MKISNRAKLILRIYDGHNRSIGGMPHTIKRGTWRELQEHYLAHRALNHSTLQVYRLTYRRTHRRPHRKDCVLALEPVGCGKRKIGGRTLPILSHVFVEMEIQKYYDYNPGKKERRT